MSVINNQRLSDSHQQEEDSEVLSTLHARKVGLKHLFVINLSKRCTSYKPHAAMLGQSCRRHSNPAFSSPPNTELGSYIYRNKQLGGESTMLSYINIKSPYLNKRCVFNSRQKWAAPKRGSWILESQIFPVRGATSNLWPLVSCYYTISMTV